MNGTVNMSFFEWFGIIALNAYYGNAYNNPFDFFMTAHFQPIGSAPNLPLLTNTYVCF